MATKETYDVILRLLLEDGKVSENVAGAAASMEKLEKSVDRANDDLGNQKKILDDLKDSLKKLKEQQKGYTKGSQDYRYLDQQIKNVSKSISDQSDRVKKETAEYSKLKAELQQVEKEQKDQIALMQRQAGALNSLAGARSKELADLKEKAAWIESGARPLFALGISSFAAITLLAKKYIDNTEESNEITQRWAASTERVQAAQMRIGKIAAEAVLPLYEKLADIAEKAADFVEKNPGVIEGGLKASIVAAGLGGIGLLVAKGISLKADLGMIAVGNMQLKAAQIMATAAANQLAAATGGKVAGAATATGAAGKVATAATGGKIAATAAGVTAADAAILVVLGTIAAKLSTMLVDLILQRTGVASKIQAAQEKAAESGGAYPGVNPYARNQQAQTIAFSQQLDAMLAKFGTSLSNLGITVGASTAAANINATANTTAAQASTQAAQAAEESAKASQNASYAFYNVQRSSAGAAQYLAQVPAAMSSLGSSISSFFQRIISSFSGLSLSKPPTHDYTGYAYTRTYAMAQDGKRQFVMSGDMTRVAEKMLGGQLNQQAVLQAMAGGTTNRSVSVNGLRFSGEYTKSMKRAVQNDMLNTLKKVID